MPQQPHRPLEGKTAIVTGAGQGLGRAEALELARRGANVVVNDYGATPESSDGANAVAAEIAADGGRAVAHAADVSDWAASRALVERAVAEFGDLDVLVNNAGVLRDRMLFNMEEAEWDAVLAVHLKGHFCMSRHATAHWRARAKAAGGPVPAAVVNTSSEAFLNGSPGQPNYAAAKSGIVALTIATARGSAAHGVRANAVCPRANTAMTSHVFTDGPRPEDPFAPERVAPLVAWLASPAAERVTGQVFVAYAGMVALLAAPSLEARFDTDSGAWDLEGLDAALTPYFADRDPDKGFAADEVVALAKGLWGAEA